jgi:hypothetical protein
MSSARSSGERPPPFLKETEMILIGVDTGGTFTDFVFKEGDRWGVYKSLSTLLLPPMPFLRERVTSGCTARIKQGHVEVRRLE